MQIVSIYDEKLRAYSGLFLVATLSVAVRQFSDSVRRDETIQAHPEDFSLVKLGDFNEDTGEIVPCAPSLVVAAAAVVRTTAVPASGEVDLSLITKEHSARGDA